MGDCGSKRQFEWLRPDRLAQAGKQLALHVHVEGPDNTRSLREGHPPLHIASKSVPRAKQHSSATPCFKLVIALYFRGSSKATIDVAKRCCRFLLGCESLPSGTYKRRQASAPFSKRGIHRQCLCPRARRGLRSDAEVAEFCTATVETRADQ